MASSDGPTSQTSGSRSSGPRSRQAGRRGRAVVRSLRHLPPSVVLLTGLLAGLAFFQLLRAAQQAESADALAAWAGACARLEEAYGTDASRRSGSGLSGSLPVLSRPGKKPILRFPEPAGRNSPPDPLPLQPFPAICSVRRLSQRGLRPPQRPLRPSSVSFQTRPLRIPSSRGNHRRPRKQEHFRSGRICSRQAACLPYRSLPSPKVTGKTRKARPPRS